jgi:hypothetical protein
MFFDDIVDSKRNEDEISVAHGSKFVEVKASCLFLIFIVHMKNISFYMIGLHIIGSSSLGSICTSAFGGKHIRRKYWKKKTAQVLG